MPRKNKTPQPKIQKYSLPITGTRGRYGDFPNKSSDDCGPYAPEGSATAATTAASTKEGEGQAGCCIYARWSRGGERRVLGWCGWGGREKKEIDWEFTD